MNEPGWKELRNYVFDEGHVGYKLMTVNYLIKNREAHSLPSSSSNGVLEVVHRGPSRKLVAGPWYQIMESFTSGRTPRFVPGL